MPIPIEPQPWVVLTTLIHSRVLGSRIIITWWHYLWDSMCHRCSSIATQWAPLKWERIILILSLMTALPTLFPSQWAQTAWKVYLKSTTTTFITITIITIRSERSKELNAQWLSFWRSKSWSGRTVGIRLRKLPPTIQLLSCQLVKAGKVKMPPTIKTREAAVVTPPVRSQLRSMQALRHS